jgi:uncharacterized C2H2 Zn-finger protein
VLSKEARAVVESRIQQQVVRKQYPCPCSGSGSGSGCTEVFLTLHDMRVHHREAHLGKDIFVCTEEGCARKFATPALRAAHVRTHTKERPFVCTFESCDMTFVQKSNLTRHLRTHTGERPYACPLCPMAFSQKASYKYHKDVHDNNRRFTCVADNCKAAFPTASALRSHLAYHVAPRVALARARGGEDEGAGVEDQGAAGQEGVGVEDQEGAGVEGVEDVEDQGAGGVELVWRRRVKRRRVKMDQASEFFV